MTLDEQKEFTELAAKLFGTDGMAFRNKEEKADVLVRYNELLEKKKKYHDDAHWENDYYAKRYKIRWDYTTICSICKGEEIIMTLAPVEYESSPDKDFPYKVGIDNLKKQENKGGILHDLTTSNSDKKYTEYNTLAKIVEQLDKGEYECVGGYLKRNVAYIALKILAAHEVFQTINKPIPQIETTRQTSVDKIVELMISYKAIPRSWSDFKRELKNL